MEAKYAFWGAIIAAIIGVSGNYLFDLYKENKEEKIQKAKIKELEKNNNASINISSVYMPPINTKIKSVFFTKIENTSPVVAKDLNIKVNFGESTVYECEAQPLNILKKEQDLENGIFELNVNSLKRGEELYLYCQISNPIFKSILVTGNNLINSNKYTFENYKGFKDGIFTTKGTTFFEIIGYILFIIFTGYFTLLTIVFLNKKFSTLWG